MNVRCPCRILLHLKLNCQLDRIEQVISLIVGNCDHKDLILRLICRLRIFCLIGGIRLCFLLLLRFRIFFVFAAFGSVFAVFGSVFAAFGSVFAVFGSVFAVFGSVFAVFGSVFAVFRSVFVLRVVRILLYFLTGRVLPGQRFLSPGCFFYLYFDVLGRARIRGLLFLFCCFRLLAL